VESKTPPLNSNQKKLEMQDLTKSAFFVQQPTKGFVQLGHNMETISNSAYPSFGFGGRNSAGLLLINFGF